MTFLDYIFVTHILHVYNLVQDIQRKYGSSHLDLKINEPRMNLNCFTLILSLSCISLPKLYRLGKSPEVPYQTGTVIMDSRSASKSQVWWRFILVKCVNEFVWMCDIVFGELFPWWLLFGILGLKLTPILPRIITVCLCMIWIKFFNRF